jgi:hypothetical protein
MVNYLHHPLGGCFERVRRAEEHLADFESRVGIMFAKQANALGINFDPNPPHRAIQPTLPPETFYDLRFPILIGEVCYNLRSALDWLVFELAQLDAGSPQDNTQFPLEDTPEGFEGNKKRFRLHLLSPAHVALIERAQPYNGCNWAKRLRHLSNSDKHRQFIQTGGNLVYYVHSSLEKDLTRCWGYERYAPHPVAGQPPVKVKVYIASSITFPDGAPVVETVEEIKAGVADTLAAFKLEF